MPYPGLDLFPSEVTFPGVPLLVGVGGYSQPIECAVGDLILTATDEFGVDWVQDTLSGWFGSPGSSLQPAQKTRAPGAWPGPRQMTLRTLAVAGFVEAPNPALLSAALDRLNAAVSVGATTLTVSDEAGLTRSCIVQRQDEVLVGLVGDTTAVWSAQLQALDPRKFSAAVTGATGLPSSSGGMTYPYTFPYSFDSVVVSGQVHLSNPGNEDGPVVLRIDGPITGPSVTHVASGAQLSFASSLALAAGEWLTVDMEAQQALANGLVSRNAYITQRGWSAFEPGDNTWTFAAVSGTGQLTVVGTPTWQ